MNKLSPIHTYILKILLLSLIISACSSKSNPKVEKDKDPIVSVYNKTLYRSDLEEGISERIGAGDSIESAEAYIKMWINEELIYEKAKQNVADRDRINELVENYRQSLIVFTYLEQLLKEEFSKKLSDSELKEYYDNNPNNFKLQSNIIKGLFLKIPRGSSEINNIRKWYKLNTTEAKESIEKASIQNAVVYDYFYDNWVSSDDILPKMPMPISDQSNFIKSNKNFETQDSAYVYFLHIEEYGLTGTNAPYSYAKPQITDILTNRKRESYLKQFATDLYDKAVRDDNVKYYIQRELNTSDSNPSN